MTKTNLAYFKAAKAMSEMSDHPQYKVGAVVVMNHRIISSGHNSDSKTHPLQKKYNRYRFTDEGDHKQHAELAALLPLIRTRTDLSNAMIFTYREHKNERIAMSRPCPSCLGLIKDLGIKRIFYTTEDGYAYERLYN
jgi:deoxycytidylate deaminase